jgi:MOSC domain-containing protein YiiM
VTPGSVVSVSRGPKHAFSKPVTEAVRLVEGFGVEGDAHAGPTTQHRAVKRRDPGRANLTQVHFIASELFAELAADGFTVTPGQLGENVTTRGLDLVHLPVGTRLHLGDDAVVEITGLRSPCTLINKFQNGLMKACVGRDDEGHVVLKAGIMGIVVSGGEVSASAAIVVELPSGKHRPLEIV